MSVVYKNDDKEGAGCEGKFLLERQKWMQLHSQAVSELRACQGLLSINCPDADEVALALSFTGGSLEGLLPVNG